MCRVLFDVVFDAACSFFAAVQCQSAPTPQHFIKICRSGKRFVGKLLSDLQLLHEIVLKYASPSLAACLLATQPLPLKCIAINFTK